MRKGRTRLSLQVSREQWARLEAVARDRRVRVSELWQTLARTVETDVEARRRLSIQAWPRACDFQELVQKLRTDPDWQGTTWDACFAMGIPLSKLRNRSDNCLTNKGKPTDGKEDFRE